MWKNKVAACGLKALLIGIFLLAAVCICHPVFYLNDDVTIRSILSGSYTGVPDGHAVYMKYPLTGCLSLLYRICDTVPWLEIFFFGMICLSAEELWSGAEHLLEKGERIGNDIFGRILRGALVFAFVLPFWLYMHYTVVAALLAGTAVFLAAIGRGRYKPVILWLLAYMVRSQAALLSLPFLAMACAWRMLGGGCKPERTWIKKVGAEWGIMLLGLLAGMILCAGINRVCYSSPEWQGYLDYNDARTELFDYTDFHSSGYYGKEPERFGMTDTEYALLASYNTMLASGPDGEALEQIGAAVSDHMKDGRSAAAEIAGSIRQYYYEIRYGSNVYAFVWILAYALLVLLILINRQWCSLGLLACLGLGRSLIWIYLILQGRFPERVSLSLYVIELLLLFAWILQEISNGHFSTGPARNIATWAAGAAGILVLLLLGRQVYLDGQRAAEQRQVQQEWTVLKQYCAEHKDTLYLMDVFSAVEYGDMLGGKDANNLMYAGGWMTGSPLAGGRFETVGASDGAEALTEGADVVFLAEKGRDISWLETLLTERFGQVTLHGEGQISCSEDKVFECWRVMKE